MKQVLFLSRLENSFFAMSTLSRRGRLAATTTTAAPSPDAPPPTRLLDLPTELLVRALSGSLSLEIFNTKQL